MLSPAQLWAECELCLAWLELLPESQRPCASLIDRLRRHCDEGDADAAFDLVSILICGSPPPELKA